MFGHALLVHLVHIVHPDRHPDALVGGKLRTSFRTFHSASDLAFALGLNFGPYPQNVRMVQTRTRIMNQLQAMALNEGFEF
jgi:hypothetical protein